VHGEQYTVLSGELSVARERQGKLQAAALPFGQTFFAGRLYFASLVTCSNCHIFLLLITITKGAERRRARRLLYGYEIIFFNHKKRSDSLVSIKKF
jgi:hypothetical protein